MLAVHWAPVSRTKNILKNGIKKSGNGLYCFPLTGHRSLDKWWLNFFNQRAVRNRKKYNGIVFRIKKEDLPVYLGHWHGATVNDDFKKEITTLKELGLKFRETLLFRIGENIAIATGTEKQHIGDPEKQTAFYLQLAEQEIAGATNIFSSLMNDLDLMTYTFEDYQIVLSHSIPANRIIKLIPQADEFGRVLRRKKIAAQKNDH